MGYCLHVVYCIQQFWATKHGDEHVSGVLKYISVCECVEAILCVFALHRVQRSWALSLRVGLKPDRVLQQVLLKSPAYVCFLTALIYHTINSITFNTTQTHTHWCLTFPALRASAAVCSADLLIYTKHAQLHRKQKIVSLYLRDDGLWKLMDNHWSYEVDSAKTIREYSLWSHLS